MSCMKFSELRCKEVICVNDGARLGFICDVRVEIPDGCIVAIVVPTEIRNDVMEAVNAKHGLKSKSEGMICSMAVDHMIHL